MWDSEGEAAFLDHAVAQGWDTSLVTDLRDHYLRAASSTFGEVTQDGIDDFHAAFENRLSKSDRDALVNWIVREFGGRR
jgi:hypothetical protein